MSHHLKHRPARWPYDEDTLSSKRLLRSEAGRSSDVGPMIKCSPAAVRIAFWTLYILVGVVVVSLVVNGWAGAK